MSAFASSQLQFRLRPPFRQKTRCFRCKSPRASAVSIPATYEALYQRAANAAVTALGAGLPALEIEFPATPSLSRSGDGSRGAEKAERESNARLAAVVARAVHESGARVAVVAFDQRMADAVRKNAGGSGVAVVRMGEAGSLPTGSVLVASPAGEAEWNWLENAVASGRAAAVVCNGAFYNGLEWLEPAFHLKPCSGYGASTGFLLREYPASYVVISSRTGQILEDLRVDILQQGRLRRPDFQAVSTALMKDFYAQG